MITTLGPRLPTYAETSGEDAEVDNFKRTGRGGAVQRTGGARGGGDRLESRAVGKRLENAAPGE